MSHVLPSLFSEVSVSLSPIERTFEIFQYSRSGITQITGSGRNHSGGDMERGLWVPVRRAPRCELGRGSLAMHTDTMPACTQIARKEATCPRSRRARSLQKHLSAVKKTETFQVLRSPASPLAQRLAVLANEPLVTSTSRPSLHRLDGWETLDGLKNPCFQ